GVCGWWGARCGSGSRPISRRRARLFARSISSHRSRRMSARRLSGSRPGRSRRYSRARLLVQPLRDLFWRETVQAHGIDPFHEGGVDRCDLAVGRPAECLRLRPAIKAILLDDEHANTLALECVQDVHQLERLTAQARDVAQDQDLKLAQALEERGEPCIDFHSRSVLVEEHEALGNRPTLALGDGARVVDLSYDFLGSALHGARINCCPHFSTSCRERANTNGPTTINPPIPANVGPEFTPGANMPAKPTATPASAPRIART